jgi:Tol biopolymer transport system component
VHPLAIYAADRGDGVDRLYFTRDGATAEELGGPSGGAMATPRFSPNGDAVVYAAQATRGGRFHLELLWLPTGEIQALTGPCADADDLMPAWSPDGKRLAWMRHRAVTLDAAADIEVWGMALADGAPRRLTWNREMDCYPAFTADSSALLIERGPVDGAARIVLVGWDGSEALLVDADGASANGIPDAHGSYVMIERAIIARDAPDSLLFTPYLFDIRQPDRLAALSDMACAANPTPRFSPDGSMAAYHRPGRDGGAIGVAVVKLDGLADGLGALRPQEIAFLPCRNRQLLLPRWSRDGAFLAAEDRANRQIVLMDLKRNLSVMPAPGPARGQRFMEIWNFDIC